MMKDRKLGKYFNEGEVIFREGDKAETMYVIQQGRIRIVKESDTGQTTLAVLESGDIFGEMALFDRLPRSATAIADKETSVLSINKAKLFSSASQDPTLVFKIIESMSSRIRNLDKQLTGLIFKQSQHERTHLESTCDYVIASIGSEIPCENQAVLLWESDLSNVEFKYKGMIPDVEMLQKAGLTFVLEKSHANPTRMITVDKNSAVPSLYNDIAFEVMMPLFHNDDVIGLISFSDSVETHNVSKYEALINLAAFTIENAWVMDRIIKTTKIAMFDSAS